MIRSVRTTTFMAALLFAAFPESVAIASVRPMTLAEFAQDAEFIGVVRVDRVSVGIPFLKRPRATATILESWKGKATGTVRFGAAASWVCDISDARKGEEAVVFIRDGELVLAGRGRMPIFTRDGRRLAAIWPDVRLPPGITTEAGPEPEYEFIRGIGVTDLHDAVVDLVSANVDQE